MLRLSASAHPSFLFSQCVYTLARHLLMTGEAAAVPYPNYFFFYCGIHFLVIRYSQHTLRNKSLGKKWTQNGPADGEGGFFTPIFFLFIRNDSRIIKSGPACCKNINKVRDVPTILANKNYSWSASRYVTKKKDPVARKEILYPHTSINCQSPEDG